MNDMNNVIQNNKMNVKEELTILPVENDFDLSKYEKIPIATIGELGAIGTPVIEAVNAITSGSGGSGLYMVNTAGGTLFKCAEKGAYIGGMTTASGKIGQAALTPIALSPVTLCSTLTMASTMIKLDEISRDVKEILTYIDISDRATIKGGMDRLIEIMDEYKENANNKELLKVAMEEVRIRHLNDMLQMREKYKNRIDELIRDNKSNIEHYNKIRKAYYYYIWATYLLCICKFMLIGYEEKYDNAHLMREKEKISKYNDEIKSTYKECYEYIENHYDKSLIERVKQVGEFLATTYSEVPTFISNPVLSTIASLSKEPIHDNRINAKEKEINRIEEVNKPDLERLMNRIDSINKFYNEPFNMMVDKDNIYIEKVYS